MDFDFLSSNLQIAYPFVDNVTVGRFGVDTELNGLVADCAIRTIDQRDETLSVEQIYIESSVFPTTVEEAVIVLVWTTSSTTVTLSLSGATTQFDMNVYGSWVVAEWYAPSELSGSDDIAIKVVFPLSVVETALGVSYIQIDKKVDDLLLQSSTVDQGPNKLRRVYWKRGSTLELVADRGEDFIVQAGFNMSIGASASAAGEEDRKLTRVAVDAVPGAGAGQYLLCPGSEYLYTLNAVPANTQGDLTLNPKECYWSARDLASDIVAQTASHGITGSTTLVAAEVAVNNACSACCSCDDYVATYEHLQAMWLQAVAASDRIYAVRDIYTSLIAQYEATMPTCTGAGIALRSLGSTGVMISASICNDTENTLENVALHISATSPAGTTVAYLPPGGWLTGGAFGFSLWPATSSSGSSATIELPVCLEPNTTIYWRGRWEMSGTGATAGYPFTATSIVTADGLATPYSVGGSIILTV